MPFYAIIFRLPYGNEYLSFTFTARLEIELALDRAVLQVVRAERLIYFGGIKKMQKEISYKNHSQIMMII